MKLRIIMRKNKSHVPFKETVQFSLRGFKVWWKENPRLLLSVLISGVVSSLTLAYSIGIFRYAEQNGTREYGCQSKQRQRI